MLFLFCVFWLFPYCFAIIITTCALWLIFCVLVFCCLWLFCLLFVGCCCFFYYPLFYVLYVRGICVCVCVCVCACGRCFGLIYVCLWLLVAFLFVAFLLVVGWLFLLLSYDPLFYYYLMYWVFFCKTLSGAPAWRRWSTGRRCPAGPGRRPSYLFYYC